MALSYVGGGEGNNGSGNDITITLPGGVATNDVVYACGGWASISNGNPGVTTSGYSELADLYQNDSNDANFSANRKVMGATPDSSVVCTGSGGSFDGNAYVVHVWRGANTTTPEDATTTTAGNINTPIVDSPAIVTVTANAIVLTSGIGVGTNGTGDSTVTAPSGYGNQVDDFGAGGSRECTTVIASKSVASPGSEDPAAWGTWTDPDNAGSWAAVSIAIRPAATEVTLTIQNAIHEHIADNIGLTQVHALSVQNAVHSQIADNVALTQSHNLVIDNSVHAHTADNLDITISIDLVIQDATHAHQADNLNLSQVHLLTVQDTLHGHTADNLTLTQVHTLELQDALHGHLADNIGLTQVHQLSVDNAIHAHNADNVQLTQLHLLSVNNATHGHTAENVVLTLANNKIFIGADLVQDIYIGATPVTKVYLGSDLLGVF